MFVSLLGVRLLCAFRSGISLAADQWEKLKALINQVDKDLKKSRWNQDWMFFRMLDTSALYNYVLLMRLKFLWTWINVTNLMDRKTLCVSDLPCADGSWHCTRSYNAVISSWLSFDDEARIANRIDERTASSKQPLDFIHQWNDGCHSILHLKLFFPVDSQQAEAFAISRWVIFQLFVGQVNLVLETLFWKTEPAAFRLH